MKLIHNNFDTIEIVFQGAVPKTIRQDIQKAQEEAIKVNVTGIPITLGTSCEPVFIYAQCDGYYAYRFKQKSSGMIWQVKDSGNGFGYNIKVKIPSLALNTDGYHKCKDNLLQFMDAIGARGKTVNSKPSAYFYRADYCFDFASDVFKIDHDCILAHARMERRDINSNEVIRRNSDIETTYIGKKNNRCLAIYNKTKQVKANPQKCDWWWQMWGLDPAKTNDTIWRFEFRIGKEELRDWSIKSFEDFEARFGDTLLDMTSKIRYVTPNPNDKNRARWKNQPFWNEIIATIENDLFDFTSGADKKKIIQCQIEEKKRLSAFQLLSLLPRYMGLNGYDYDDLANALTEFEKFAADQFLENPQKFAAKIKSARDHYEFLN